MQSDQNEIKELGGKKKNNLQKKIWGFWILADAKYIFCSAM